MDGPREPGKRLLNKIARSRSASHIGDAVDSNGLPELGGPINPYGASSNCVACVAAVLYNKLLNGGKRSILTAGQLQKQFNVAAGRGNPVTGANGLLQFFEKVGLEFDVYTPKQKSWDSVVEDGHYVLFTPFLEQGHILYGRVINGRKYLYDPQRKSGLIDFSTAAKLLGSVVPEIERIVTRSVT